MCRNITTLRGLEPEATDEEIEAADADRARLAEEREADLEEDLTDGGEG